MSLLIACLLAFSPVSAPDTSRALAVLHGWDAARAAAWAAGSASALRSLYVAGSTAGEADVRLLEEYADRGLVVRRIDVQVFAVQVRRAGPRLLVLRVLDRVAGGEVQQGSTTRALGTTPPRTRELMLRLVAGTWKVVSVREVSARGAAPRAPPWRLPGR